MDRGGQITQPRQPTHEDGAHESAGRKDLRVAESIAHRAAISKRLDQADSPHGPEVLGGDRLIHPQFTRNLVDFARPIAQEVQDPEAMGTGERPQQRRLELIDVVSGAWHVLLLAGVVVHRRWLLG
jgi:hypothetical protein